MDEPLENRMSAEQAYPMRWMTTHDLPEVFAIENASEAKPLTEDKFRNLLRGHQVIGMVAQNPEGKVVGFMVYRLFHEHLELIKFVVHGAHRREGVGRVMLARLKNKLNGPRKSMVIDVPEDRLGFQLLLRSCGIKCVGVTRETDSDVFRFKFTLEQPQEAAL